MSRTWREPPASNAFSVYHNGSITSELFRVQEDGEVGVVNFPAARLDAANRTGRGVIDLVSGNFHWALPLVGLPRRSGLDLGLSLSPNSLIWMREIPRRASLSASHLSSRRSTIRGR